MAFYGLGIPIGGLIGMVMGGLVADAYGWRTAFLLAGVPGILFAVLLPFLMREPRRSGTVAGMAAQAARPAGLAIGPSLKVIGQSRAMVLLVIAASLVAFLAYGKTVWTAIFFIRVHGLSPGETGLWLGISVGVAAMLGTWLGGYFADRFGAGKPRNIVLAPAIGLLLGAPLLFVGYAASDWQIGLALIVVATVLNYFYYGPTFACVQGLVPPQARAMASAVMLFAQNLIGLGLGPLFFGMLSDALKPIAGDDSVRWVLYGAAWLGIIPGIFFWLARKHLDREMGTAAAPAQ
jgi:predicted MFS family arabinose efflux permease